MVDPGLDAVSYTFGSSEDFDAYMEAYFSGEVEELSEPQVGAIALFLSEEGHLVHLGRVVLDSAGEMAVLSKDKLIATTMLTDIDATPFKDAASIIYVEPLSSDEEDS